MNMMYLWLLLVILMVFIEILTVNFGTISLAIGALGALLVYSFGADVFWQVVVFIALSALSLFFLRPIALRLMDSKEDYRLNADGVVGKVAIVTEAIKKNYPGVVRVQGKEWTAITGPEAESFEPGQEVLVIEIQGVKLVVASCEKEE